MIDWTRVRELREEIGQEAFSEVVTVFIEEVEEVIARLRADPADRSRLIEDLHFLKGSALNLGFGDLGDLCTAYETRLARAEPVSPADVLALLDCHDSSMQMFRTALAEGTI